MLILVLLLQLARVDAMLLEGRNDVTTGNYRAAAGVLSAAIPLAENSTLDRGIVAASFSDLAEAYRQLGRYDESEKMFKRSLAMFRELPGKERHATVVLSNMAASYRDSGQFVRSYNTYQEALKVAKTCLQPSDPLFGTIQNGIGTYYYWKGDLSKSQKSFEQALTILRDRAETPMSVAETLNNFAALEHRRKHPSKAEALYKEALQITSRAIGSNTLDAAITWNNLGVLYWEQKRNDEAESAFVQALAIRRELLPAGNPRIASTLFNLSKVMMDTGRIAQAEPLLKEAVDIHTSHPHVITAEETLAFENYANVLRLTGRTTDAKLFAERAKSMRLQLQSIVRY